MRRTFLPFRLGIVFASLGAPLPMPMLSRRTRRSRRSRPGSVRCSPLDEAAPPAAADTLSDTLAPCGGVLAPPPVGDQEMTVDAAGPGRNPDHPA